MKRILAFTACITTLLLFTLPAAAQDKPTFHPSTCAAIARSLPNVIYAAFTPASLAEYQVRITYAGHSTYVIESAAGVTIATDYNGFSGPAVPSVVTMNRAHTSHYTDHPSPEIDHVLRGWNPEGGVAAHYLVIDDVLIRNVTTDINQYGLRIPDANSIFIFEVAGLCIGHLGHLHHRLTDDHFARIGRLDVLMVPIDGGMTLDLEGMSEIVKRLRSSVILPMHARGWATPADFISMLGEAVDHEYLKSRSLTLSLNDLPSRPTVIVPQGVF